MFIPVILGTAREGRNSEKVAKFVLEEVRRAGLETELIDVRDYRTEATNNTEEIPQAQKLGTIIEKADGLIIVSPEYNHGYPGELKMFLDMLYDQYAGKPLGICGVSMGPLGGARMVEQLRQVSIELHMVPIREAIYFPVVQNLFDEKGVIKDPGMYAGRIKTFLDELVMYAKTLKKTRESKEG
jgi:NAD(P)H-dependent FMN reductase